MADLESICGLAFEACSAWRVGDLDRAKGTWTQLRQMDSGSPLWPTLLARASLEEKAPREAKAFCDEAIALGSRGAEALLLRGQAWLQLSGSSDEAESGEAMSQAKIDIERAHLIGGLSKETGAKVAELVRELGIQVTINAAAGAKALSSASVGSSGMSAGAQGKAVASCGASGAKTSPAPPAAVTAEPPAAPAGDSGAAFAAAEKALESESKGLVRAAREHCAAALRSVPGLPQAVLCLARMELANNNGAAATKLLRKTHPAVLKSASSRFEGLSICAAAAEQAQDWDTAMEELELVARIGQQEAQEASRPKKQGWGPKPKLEDVMGRLARARWKAGERDAATSLAQQLLESAPHQIEACEVACDVLTRKQDYSTALALMVRCVIAHRDEPSSLVGEMVSCVMKRSPVDELVKILSQGSDGEPSAEQLSSIAEVVAYLGLILKDRSDVIEACCLYRKAVIMAPQYASLCLNLTHTYGLRGDDLRAIAWCLRYFEYLGRSNDAARVLCKIIRGEALGDEFATAALSASQFKKEADFNDTMAIAFAVLKLLYLGHPSSDLVAADTTMEGEKLAWQAKLTSMDIEKEPADALASRLISKEMLAGRMPSFGLVKAHHNVLLRLSLFLERSREGRDLHLTNVRNEHAYFCCIRDILQMPDVPGRPAVEVLDTLAPIHVIGDSHVLSSAWQTVEIGGQRHVLLPSLVTGCKIWHLRDESTMYTKFAFWDRIGAVPKGAPVVLVLGEIDCREGILLAVQKGRHESVEAALVAAVELYLSVLKQVRKKLPSSKIFVHPVAQVLPETRALTVSFNTFLSNQAIVGEMAKLNVKLLHFPSVFVESSASLDALDNNQLAKLELLPDLKLDGTHMSPRYVKSHLESALVDTWST